ncbi:hypothetical protein [Bacillus wiedmannii]|uniref:hypothetical protein n=1 Tax=Bacillus wiedmannii TaxID=1890302 RepID=UPI000BF089EF|nr:hypothetical protein [Bacillus wiedmannii]PEL83273.1 hypothetical protein CN626_29635 [Bacillus wiedmannii]HDR3653141.1 hypothetical protein [Bacillus anthracis]
MTEKQRKYEVTFYLSNGREVIGRTTQDQDRTTYLKAIQTLIEEEKTLSMDKIGIILQTKYITHVKIIEVAP